MVELEAYQKTDAYKNFLKKQAERKRKSKQMKGHSTVFCTWTSVFEMSLNEPQLCYKM